jgi:hypothetical protein
MLRKLLLATTMSISLITGANAVAYVDFGSDAAKNWHLEQQQRVARSPHPQPDTTRDPNDTRPKMGINSITEADIAVANYYYLEPKINKCFDILQFESLSFDPQTKVFSVRQDQIALLNSYFQVEGWLGGFFTARNVFDLAAGGDTAKGTTEKERMPWIYSYCRSHPTKTLFDAAVELSNTLSSTLPKE